MYEEKPGGVGDTPSLQPSMRGSSSVVGGVFHNSKQLRLSVFHLDWELRTLDCRLQYYWTIYCS